MRGSRTIPGAGAPCARWSVSARACWPARNPISNPLVASLGIALVAVLGLAWYMGARLLRSERDRRRATDELNRRLSELFSLQELSYVLSDSLELERIADQVVRFALRFLEARGALVALATGAAGGGAAPLRVAAALGTLADLKDHTVDRNDAGLLARSLSGDKLELVRHSGGGPTRLLRDIQADSAAAVPLHAHGVTVGTLLVTDPRSGSFAPEDIRLLSTLATHAAVVLSNARFFDLVRQAKDEWETAFDALTEGMALVDEEGRVRRANRALAALLGRPVEAVVGQHLCDALLGQTQALLELLDAARRGERPAPLVTRSAPLDRTVRVAAARMPDPAASRTLVVLVEDVTEQQTLEAQLIQSEKLAAVGHLVSGVAHELNNPLTSIAGLSEFLLEQKELGPKDRRHLKVIHEQAERAGRIVRNLLTFARKSPDEHARVDLNDVVLRTLLLMSYDLKFQEIEAAKDLAAVLPDVLGDRHALQQVVLNLLTNASHAVAGNAAGLPRRITVRTWFDGQVHLRVADTGPGIADAVATQLFTPFFTTKEPGQGTGLGLSISYSIVEAHDGHLVLERPSSAGGASGAAFVVTLPPAPADAPRTAPARSGPTAAPVEPAAVRRTILLVDDDPAVRRVVQALFAREGHRVEVAKSAQHALELTGARWYDLILVDARAANRGRLLVEEMLAKKSDLKERILVATGDVRPATEETLRRLGLRYVRKPFNLRDLRDEAARVWAATTLS